MTLGVCGGACSTWPACKPGGGCERRDEQEALQALLRPSDLILGVDGHVHYGEARRFKGGAVLRGVICGVLPMRAIGPPERWWTTEPSRVCAECGTTSRETVA